MMLTLLLSFIDCLIYIITVCLVVLVAVGLSMPVYESEFIQTLISLFLPFVVKNFRWLVLVSGITVYCYLSPAFLSDFFIQTMATLLFLIDHLIYLFYIGCIVALSYILPVIAYGTIRNTLIWWPEFIHTSIVGFTLRLLNMMWGSPFQKPSIESDIKSILVGVGVYLLYIVCSMALSFKLFDMCLLLKTFVISLTFVLLDVVVKPCSFSDMIETLVGLAGGIATSLLPLFFLAALSFVVFVFVYTWAEMLVPSITQNYPMGTFVSIAGLTFMVMQTILGIPVEEPSMFLDMKVGLLGITDMINKYQGAYVVIKSLTVLVIPLLSRESRPIMYTTAACIVAISLLPPGPGTPTEYPASTLVTDDFVQKTITNFVSSQINGASGRMEKFSCSPSHDS